MTTQASLDRDVRNRAIGYLQPAHAGPNASVDPAEECPIDTATRSIAASA